MNSCTVLLLFLILPVVLLSQIQAEPELNAASRFDQAGNRQLRLLLGAEEFDGGLSLRQTPAGEYRLGGGIGLPWFKAGTIETRGIVREMLLPIRSLPSSPDYGAAPGVILLRGWENPRRYGAAAGLPGTGWLMISGSDADTPELTAALEIAPVRFLKAAAGIVYGRLPESDPDEWIIEQGMPPEGEVLLTALRLTGGGKQLETSAMGSISLHPWLPPGYYLRWQARLRSPDTLGGLRYSVASFNYRTPRAVEPPFSQSAAAELELFRRRLLKPQAMLEGKLDHSEPGSLQPSDWKVSATAGVRLDLSPLSLELERSAELRRSEGEPGLQELLEAWLNWDSRGGMLAVQLEGSLFLTVNRLDRLICRIRTGHEKMPLDLETGIKADREFGEPPLHYWRVAEFGVALLLADWELKAMIDAGDEEPGWRIEGSRSIRLQADTSGTFWTR